MIGEPATWWSMTVDLVWRRPVERADENPSSNLGRGTQGDAIRAVIMSPQVDDRGPRPMSTPHKRHRVRVSNLMTQSKTGAGHDTMLRPWSTSSTNRVTRRRLEQQCQAQRAVASMATVRTVSDSVRDYRPSRECLMNDSSRDGTLVLCAATESRRET